MMEDVELIRSINLKIPAKMVQIAEKVGEGNYTEGFRRMVDFFEQSNALDLPDWFFSSSWELKDIHKLIRTANRIENKDKLVKDLWRKGDSKVRALLTDICREDSFLYLPWVRDALSALITFEDEKKEMRDLKNKLLQAREEIAETNENIEKLNTEIENLTKQKVEIEASIKAYNEDMLKIATFKPIDAVHGMFGFLDELLTDFNEPGPVKSRIKNARDLALKMVQHIDRYSVPDEVALELRAKMQLMESIQMLESKDVRKQFKKLFDKLKNIQPANKINQGLLENGNYYALDGNTFSDIDGLAGKIMNVIEEVGK
jgi:DNA repair exonuclease SbcCD ATPase subunit